MKKGISLIVLVITIIVIIILAGAVILSLVQNNPISQANEATRANDAAEIKSALAMYLGTIMGQYKDTVKLDVPDTKTVALEGAKVVNNNNVPLFRSTTGVVNAFADQAAADTAGAAATPALTYAPLTITAANLGFGNGFPAYGGYYLIADQYANVTYSATAPTAPVVTP